MVDKDSSLSLGKRHLSGYDAIDILMYLELNRSLKFLFDVNRQTRHFLEHNYHAIDRNYENEGLAVKHIKIDEDKDMYETLKFLDKVCAQTILRRVDNQNLTLEISAGYMQILESIFKTIESIKAKHSGLKIKIASIKLGGQFVDSQHVQLVELVSKYKVKELDISFIFNQNQIQGLPQLIERVFLKSLNQINLSPLTKLRELHFQMKNYDDLLRILAFLQVQFSEEHFKNLTLFVQCSKYNEPFVNTNDNSEILVQKVLLLKQITIETLDGIEYQELSKLLTIIKEFPGILIFKKLYFEIINESELDIIPLLSSCAKFVTLRFQQSIQNTIEFENKDFSNSLTEEFAIELDRGAQIPFKLLIQLFELFRNIKTWKLNGRFQYIEDEWPINHQTKLNTFIQYGGEVKPNIIPWSKYGIQDLDCHHQLLVQGLGQGKFQPLNVLKLRLSMFESYYWSQDLEPALARMINLNSLSLFGLNDTTSDFKINISAFIPFMKNLRHLSLEYWGSNNGLMKIHGQQLGELLTQWTKISTYKMSRDSWYRDESQNREHLELIIRGFMNNHSMRLKPLKVKINQPFFIDVILDLEEMIKQHPNLSSQLDLTFLNWVQLMKGGTNLVQKMVEAKKINEITHPILHEYFTTKEFQQFWMD